MVSDRPTRLDESKPRTGVVILFPRARPGRLSTMRRIFLDRRNGGLRLYLCGDLVPHRLDAVRRDRKT
jgi:hypothetical protein